MRPKNPRKTLKFLSSGSRSTSLPFNKSFWTFSSSSNKKSYAGRWFQNRFHNYSTTDGSYQKLWIVNRSGYYRNVWRKSYKKSEIPYSWSTSSNILLVKKKVRGLLMYKFKNTRQLFSLLFSWSTTFVFEENEENICSWGNACPYRGKRFSLFFFWIMASSKEFFETINWLKLPIALLRWLKIYIWWYITTKFFWWEEHQRKFQ